MNPKIVQCDKRGQVVIPKDIRDGLKLGENSAFWIIVKNGEIVLKPIEEPKLR
jgi:AbrB family looped-hinge helix DNA binding protein